MKVIKCKKCGSIGTIIIDLFHSGYLTANDDGTTDLQESEDTPEQDNKARCYNCDAEYTDGEYQSLVTDISFREAVKEHLIIDLSPKN